MLHARLSGSHDPPRNGHYALVSDDLEPVDDDAVDDDTPWDRFAGGLPIDGDDAASVAFVWDVLALSLAAAAALLFLGSLVQAFSFFGVSMRDRAFVVSADGASALTAALALGAVVIETAVGDPWKRLLGRWGVACASVTSVAVLVSAVYAIGYLALVHPNVGSQDFSVAMLRAAQAASSWSVRVEGMLRVAAAGVLAGAAIYLVRRAARATARRTTPDELSAP